MNDALHSQALLSLLVAQRQPAGDVAGDSWVHRRVERLSLIDERSLRRHWTIEFQLPRVIAGISTHELAYVPLGWVDRQERARDFDLRDEDGRPVSLVSPRESARVAISAIDDYALRLVDLQACAIERASPAVLHDKVMTDIRSIVAGDKQALERFRAAAPAATAKRLPHLSAETFQRAVMMAGVTVPEPEPDSGLVLLLEALTQSYLLSAVLPGAEARDRLRVLTLAWTVSGTNSQTLWMWIATRMAWTSTVLGGKPRNVDAARNYLLELSSPSDDIELGRSQLVVGRNYHDEDHGDPAQLRFTMSRLLSGELSDGLDFGASFEMRASRIGLMPLALVACALSTALLAIGFVRLDALSVQIEGAATLLLVIPGLLSLYVVRPGEHRVASMIFSGVRCMVLTAAGCVLGAGLLLLVDADPGWRRLLWASLLVICGAATLAVAVGGLRATASARWDAPRPHKARDDGAPRGTAGQADAGRRLREIERWASLHPGSREAALYVATVCCCSALLLYTLSLWGGWAVPAALGGVAAIWALLATAVEHRATDPPRSARPRVAAQSRVQPRVKRRRGLQAAALYVLSAGLCVTLAAWLTGGRDRLGLEHRLLSAIEQAASANHRLDLSSFAERPWTRLRVFSMPASRPQVLRALGGPALADAQRLAPSIKRDEALVVLVQDDRIAAAFAVRDSRADLTALEDCVLDPSTAVKIHDGSPPSLVAPGCAD